MRGCPNCGEENSDRARFCQACGATMPGVDPAPEVRKTVTVLFSDVAGSTALGERLDPESVRRLMGRYFDAMHEVLERHGGTVEKFIGDAVMAVFGIPRLHEDDALRTVRSAVEMRDRLDALNGEFRERFGVEVASRTGVHTGQVVAGDPARGQTLVTGDAVNTAARLEQAATAGEILIGETTQLLVRDAIVAEPVEPIDAKGKAEPVPAFRLVDVIAGAESRTRRLDAPMIVYELGRHDEAMALADEAEASSAADDMEPQIWLHGVRAKVLARRGRFDDAEREARENARLAEQTDWPAFTGMAWSDLAEVLHLTGRPDDAAMAARRAEGFFEQKGSLVLRDRVRRFREGLESQGSGAV